MRFRALIGSLVVGALASAAPAAFMGTVDFEDGTTGGLGKQLDTSNHQGFTIADFGGPGNLEFNYHGTQPSNNGFKSTYLLAGGPSGDVYSDVILRALYKPSSNGFEFALTARVKEFPSGSFGNTASGWGIWATGGTMGFAPGLNIAFEPELGASGSVRATVANWADTTPIVISATTWYDVIFSTIGTTATATMTQLDGSFQPVSGKTATVSYNMNTTPAEFSASGFAGTRGAQTNASAGYILDNVFIVPEPSSLMLLGLGGLCMMRRRRIA
jgi:hypothetical protein